MKKAKVISAKRSLVMSVLSLILCFAMLIGTTYAWFTDSVTSGVNQIKAGNLDVELLHKGKNDTTATSVENETKLFDDITLWEPGAYVYETFTVKNVGNLALKYSMALNVASFTSYNGHDLTEVLKVATLDSIPTSRADITGGTALKEWSLDETERPLYPVDNKPGDGASEKTFTVAIYWEPTDHDNDFNMNNGRPQPLSVDLGVQLIATQLEYESDSFDNTYDAGVDNTLPGVTAKENAMFAAITKKLAVDGSEDLKVEKSGVFEEATVPAKVANAVFDKVFTDDATSDKSLTLVLNVEKKGEKKTETNTEINYAIDMDAVIKEIKGATVIKNETTPIDELELTFSDWVEVQLKIDAGLQNVAVKHNGNPMTKVDNKAGIPATGQNSAGYFSYVSDSGLLTLWVKDFSPFVVTGNFPQPPFKVVPVNVGTNIGSIWAENCYDTAISNGATSPKLFGIDSEGKATSFKVEYNDGFKRDAALNYIREKFNNPSWPDEDCGGIMLIIKIDSDVTKYHNTMYINGTWGWDISDNEVGNDVIYTYQPTSDQIIYSGEYTPFTFDALEGFLGKEAVFCFSADCNESIDVSISVIACNDYKGNVSEMFADSNALILGSHTFTYTPNTYTPAN